MNPIYRWWRLHTGGRREHWDGIFSKYYRLGPLVIGVKRCYRENGTSRNSVSRAVRLSIYWTGAVNGRR